MKQILRHLWFLMLMALVTGLFCACESKGRYIDDDDDTPSKPKPTGLMYAAVNINDTTHDADILVARSDGAYMLCDINYKDQCGMLYFNASNENDIDAGFFLFVDSTGSPMMLRTRKGEYFFKNVTDERCDLAYQPYGGEIEYYWDVQVPDSVAPQGVQPRRGKASLGDAITYPFTSFWSDFFTFDWTWDDAQRKAILPYMAKVTSFAITVISTAAEPNIVDILGIAALFYEEAAKSGFVDTTYVKYAEGYDTFCAVYAAYKDFKEKWDNPDKKFTGKNFGIGQLASMLNTYADNALNSVATFDEVSWEIFNHPENHVSLSRYVVNMPQSGGLAMIKVTAQDGWYLEGWKLPDWISYTVDGSYINLNISTNEDASPREHTIPVYPPSGVQPARLTIKQDGCAFVISPKEITFYGKEAHNAILVQASDKVKSWSVKSCPNWLSYETSSMTVWLDTKSSMANRGNQTGTVVIEAVLHEGGKVEQSCAVQWFPDEGNTSWDGTSWIFSGLMTFNDDSSGDLQMQLVINSVASHSATVTLMATQLSCDISEDDSHKLHGSFGYQGISGSFTVTRTSETTATCDMTIVMQGDSKVGIGTGTLTGTKQ